MAVSDNDRVMVKTGIGLIPLMEYLDIKASQNGFDDYADMQSYGYSITVSDEDKVVLNDSRKDTPVMDDVADIWFDHDDYETNASLYERHVEEKAKKEALSSSSPSDKENMEREFFRRRSR